MTNYLFDGLLAVVDPGRQFAELDDGRYYSYQDLLEVSARFANLLLARGIEPGDRVAVQVPKSIEAIMLYLATVRAGAVFLPLNNAYTANEVAYFLEDASPHLFVCDPAQRNAYSGLCDRLGIGLDTLGVWKNADESAGSITDDGLGFACEFDNVARAADDLAAILYTSGTTGRAKGAMLTHKNLLSNAVVLAEHWQFSRDDVLLHALPIFHTHGLFVATNIVIRVGASMIFQRAFKVEQIIDALPRATTMMGVPTFYTRLLAEPGFTRELVAKMRLFISGSAPLLAETHLQFEARCGHRILERYGMTETNMNTSNPYHGERRAGTVGMPLAGIDLRITNPEDGSELAAGETGMVEVRGDNVFAGYWQMPEKTAEELRADGFFITGDLGRIDAEGYLHIVGRSRDLIISGGYNIYPKEIELLLDDEDGVVESAVIGVPHADFGEAVVAVVVADAAVVDEKTLLDSIREKIARFKQPRRIFIVDRLPRNAMGKVQKNILREQYAGLFEE